MTRLLRRRRGRAGFTLLELLLALAVTSILTLGLASAVMVSTRAMDHARGGNDPAVTAANVAEEIASDLRFATDLPEQTGAAITAVVPDRDGDGQPETIRYSWTGSPDLRLEREYNHGPKATIAEDVRHFDLRYLPRTLVGVPPDVDVALPTVLLVLPNAASPTALELARKAVIEALGYVVTTISTSEAQAAIDTAVAGADVAYVADQNRSTVLGTKLRDTPIGVLNEEAELMPHFGFSKGRAFCSSRDTIDIVDATHGITSIFSPGSLEICAIPQPLVTHGGQLGDGVVTLAEHDAQGSGCASGSALTVIDTSGLLEGGDVAAGRRVQLPWGHSDFDIDALSDDGRILLARALDWAAGGDGGLAGSGGGGGAAAEANFGYEGEFPTPVSNVPGIQIATQVTLPAGGIVKRITAFVGGSPQGVRYAIYSDNGGEPDTLLIETDDVNANLADAWLSIPVPDTSLAAGTYWLALALDRAQHRYHQDAGGRTRYRDYDAEKWGFLTSWGASDDSYSIKVSIYATYTPY